MLGFAFTLQNGVTMIISRFVLNILSLFLYLSFKTLMYQVSLPENKNKQTREKNPMFFGDKGRSIIYKDIHQNVCIPSSITFDALHYFLGQVFYETDM